MGTLKSEKRFLKRERRLKQLFKNKIEKYKDIKIGEVYYFINSNYPQMIEKILIKSEDYNKIDGDYKTFESIYRYEYGRKISFGDTAPYRGVRKIAFSATRYIKTRGCFIVKATQ